MVLQTSNPSTMPQPRISDIRMLELIDLLKSLGKIRFRQDFCNEIDLLKQSFISIKTGRQHFTVEHIRAACQAYNVDANWIFGFSDKPFLPKRLKPQTETQTEPPEVKHFQLK